MSRFILKLPKLIISFVLVTAVLGSAMLIAFNLWILPALFQKYVQDELSKKFGLSLTYGRISFDPWRGILLENLSLQKKGKEELLLHRAKAVEVDLALTSLLKGSVIIDHFKIGEGEGLYVKEGFEWRPFFYKNLYGSLGRGPSRTLGLGGWLGDLSIEDLSFGERDLLIPKIQCTMTERDFRIRDAKIFWRGLPFELNALMNPAKKTLSLVCKMSGWGFLLVLYDPGKIQIGLFSSQTRLLSVTDLSRALRKSKSFFQGVLDFNDFSEMMDLWSSWKNKILFKSPVELKGQSIGLESGNLLCIVPLIAIRQPTDKNISRLRSLDLDQVKLDLDFYRHQFLIKTFEAKSCNGFIQTRGLIDLVFGAYEGQLSIQVVHLGCLGPILFPKGKGHRGFLSGSAEYLGSFGRNRHEDPLENFEVQGGLEVRKGHLGKIQLFKTVLSVFEPILPKLGKIRFKSGYARFFIRTGNLFVDELKLMSSIASVVYKGKMGLRKKDLDLDVHFSVRPLGLNDKTFLSKLISGGFSMAGEQIWKAKITGTLKKPVATPLYFSVLQPVKDILEIPFQLFQKKQPEEAKKNNQ